MRYLVCLLLTACVTACEGPREPSAGDAALANHRGSWVLINYWAQWCRPCIEEIPELNAFAETHPEVVVLGVNFDGASGEALTAQERSLGVAFTTLAEDPAAELGISRPAVLPTTLVVTPDGTVADTLLGPQTEQSLREALAAARALPASR